MRVKSNTTTRALLGSVMVLLLCTAMLVGTTFAWFTDTVNTVSTLQAGNLNVTLRYGTSKNDDGTWNYTDYDGTTGLQFLTPAGNLPTEENKVEWDAAHLTNEVQPLKLVNDGSLNLMCKVMLTGVKVAAAEQMTWELKVGDDAETTPFGKEFKLPAKAEGSAENNELILNLSATLSNGAPLSEPIPTPQVVVCVRQAEGDEDAFSGDYDKESRYQARVDAALVGTVTNTQVEGSENEIAPFVLNNAMDMATQQGAVTATIPASMGLPAGTRVTLGVVTNTDKLATDSISFEFDLQGVYDDTNESKRTTWKFNVANADDSTDTDKLATLQLNVGKDMKSVTVNGELLFDGTDSESTTLRYEYDVNTGVLTLYLKADGSSSSLTTNP